jgi:hypothetical protein
MFPVIRTMGAGGCALPGVAKANSAAAHAMEETFESGISGKTDDFL